MTIQDIGAIGEFVGAFLILATLVYLAIQNKQQQKLLLSTVSQARTDAVSDLLKEMSENADIFIKLQAKEPLSEAENFRLTLINAALLRNFENTHYQGMLGAISDEVLYMSRTNLKRNLEDNWFRNNWTNTSDTFSSPFIMWVDEIIQENEQEASEA